MADKDYLWRGTAFGGVFRIQAVEATQAAQRARDLHDLSPINTLLMGKMLSAAAMLSLDLKTPGSEVSLRLDGDGPLSGALAICASSGALRCYAFNPRLYLDEPGENFQPVKQLGTGTLSVIRSTPNKRPTVGYTSLVSGELAQNLAHYYEQSEQIPTAVNLGVLIDKDASIKAAGGFIIQQLPGASVEIAEDLIARLARTPNVSDLMDMGLSLRDILARFVFDAADFDLQPVHAVRYECNCSKDRFGRALSLLSVGELEDMHEGIDPVCHFCNSAYHFSGEEIAALISAKEHRT